MLRRYWRILTSTGVERSTDAAPRYLEWFWGFPLVSWLAGLIAITVSVLTSALSDVPPIVFAVSLFNIVATARVLIAQLRHLRDLAPRLEPTDSAPPPINAIHELWRARSAAWAYTASLAALLLLAAIRFIPGWALADLFPADLVPLYELAILGLTVSVIAILSQYTSRTAAADARVLSGELRRLSEGTERSARESSDRLADNLSVLSDRLVEATMRSAQETNSVLTELSRSVQELAESAGRQNEILTGILADTRRALETAGRATSEQAQAIRRAEQERATAASQEVARLKPRIAIRLRVQGVLMHRVWLDLYNSASPARGTVAEVVGGRVPIQATLGEIPSRVPRSQNLEDIKFFPLRGDLAVNISFLDLSGRPYRGSVRIRFERSEGLLGVTTGWSFTPPDWQWIETFEDLPLS